MASKVERARQAKRMGKAKRVRKAKAYTFYNHIRVRRRSRQERTERIRTVAFI
jgi:hypothetical protein